MRVAGRCFASVRDGETGCMNGGRGGDHVRPVGPAIVEWEMCPPVLGEEEEGGAGCSPVMAALLSSWPPSCLCSAVRG